MPKIAYERNTMRSDALTVAGQVASICLEYANAGYSLTLRQAYYQMVARGLTADWPTGHNTERSYKRLGTIADKARMCGMIDWNHLTDPTRVLRGTAHWDSPADVINSAAYSYRNDKWIGQANRVEVWVEKEALADVVSRAANASDVNYFACKGYTSSSAMWRAARRISSYLRVGQDVTILHLGDHDPSGIDMTRDIRDRLMTFVRHDVAYLADGLEVRRIALNMDQVERYNPPPNPAKLTDSRGEAYIQQYGTESWELDALPPDVLVALVNEHIDELIDSEMYRSAEAAERRDRDRLELAASNWVEIAEHIDHTYADA